ncbi:MAG: Holliday junction ATP-dependent DNA helicase RuvA [Candidatus Shapirobacteria bacterium GW2011_GWE1_38_10]|uniref:Holliday junction branch migration complex subunit RuvA n=1 Tax=Candidatus Shapirobacteria bacterium GW2011_GWE1_38_10 TaxID=1618488 RepID=A0A0G0I8J1_9BACT|nr:MAG: Holliday junction ATP-dependent DNA helicase RuvA [Candidatus Shapirobacteria bacterium GW2011_GWF2_37_20]KKQ50857.1 MAG: Holliday junction ATP-dependent DNA helicase RuvA [Candidatus Shapirobacteria bacterium GW2011_GWE1_38_10]
MVDRVWGNYIEVEVGGVGYLVWVGRRNYTEGQEVKIFTYMAVSENDMALYGFENFEDLDLFKMLITVSGVGPKSAAQILEQCKGVEIIKAIGDADTSFFEKIKGVGKKTAQRIIVDLKSKIGGLGELNLRDESPLLEDDVVLSLRQLGFERKEIENVINKMPIELEILEDKVSWCLQNLGR